MSNISLESEKNLSLDEQVPRTLPEEKKEELCFEGIESMIESQSRDFMTIFL